MNRLTLRILSYNIHKGFDAANIRFVLDGIKKSIDKVGADIVFLQEVMGQHKASDKSQFEILADRVWKHHAYGKNSAYSSGDHGNAILSQYPIISSENLNITTHALQKRGLLHAAISHPKTQLPIHLMCTHLDLFEGGRRKQIQKLSDRIKGATKSSEAVILCGDFNDWNESVCHKLHDDFGMDEAYEIKHGEHARTFPSFLPVLKLDRIYLRGCEVLEAERFTGRPWSQLSDHAALYCKIRI